MSQFLPESFDAQAETVSALPKGIVTESDLSLIKKTLSRPEIIEQVAPNFFAYMVDYLAVNQPLVPISQISGFSQFTAQSSVNNGTALRNVNSYGDPTTGDAGPSITLLPKGKYVLLYGALAWDSSGGGGTMYVSPKVNSTEAESADAANVTANTTGISIMRACLKDLSLENNTVTLRYNASSGTGRWDNRFLIALRYANL